MFIIWLVSILVLLTKSSVGASGYSKLCPLSGSPVVQLEYDPESQQFTVINGQYFADEDGGTRSLQDEHLQFGKHLSSHVFRGERSHRLAQTKTKYTARQCPCDATGATYCLIDSEMSTDIPDTCGVPQASNFLFGVSNYPYNYSNSTQGNTTIECFEMAHQTVFIRNAWPVIVLWYGALVIFFLATANGKYAQLCLVNACCPCFRVNERYVDRVLQREDEMRRRLWSLQTAAERADSIAEGPGRFLRRTRGVRVRRHLRGQGLTDDEQQEQAMAAWIHAAEAFGILNAREVSEQPMEYALRTRKFDAKKEKERRNNIHGRHEATSDNLVTPTKSKNNSNEEENGPTTPETVETNGSEGSHFDFIGPDDNSVGESLQAEDEEADLESGATECNNEVSYETDGETFDCTICLSEVCDGEEVGVLSCSHLFHVDCLREWMLRRNACPLCQTEICTPRPSSDTNGAARRNSSSEESDSGVGTSRNTTNRLYITTTSLPDFDVREPSIRRTMSGTISTASRQNRRERGRARRQQMEDPFSFAGW